MKPNVLLIILDGVRARNTTVHEYHRDTTPFLREFAADATVYEQARSPSIWSLPSHASMFTGMTSAAHGINTADDKLPEGYTIWEELSREHDYATGVFSANPFLTQICGLKNAFDDVYAGDRLLFPEAMSPRESFEEDGQSYAKFLRKSLRHSNPIKSLSNGIWLKACRDLSTVIPGDLQPDESAGTFVDEFIRWTQRTDSPWAACLNFMDAHAPYDPAPEFDRWGGEELRDIRKSIDDTIWEFASGERPWWQRQAIMALYDGCIRQMDHQIDRLITSLEANEELEDTLVVITSDHGEGFGEKSRVRPSVRQAMHAYGIHEVLLHVPLVVRTPAQQDGARITELASLINFPEVVRTTVTETDTDEGGFTVEDRLLVSSYERQKQLTRADPYLADISDYRGDAHAVYEQDGRVITKHMKWGKDATTVTIPVTTHRQQRTDGAKLVAEELARSEDRVQTAETDEVESETKRRLEDLGYL